MQHLSTYSTNNVSIGYYCRFFSNLASSNYQEIIVKILNNGLLDRYLQIIQSNCPDNISLDIIYSLSNIAADSEENIESLISHPIMQSVCDFAGCTKPKIRNEACVVISNMCFVGNEKQLLRLFYG
jgi:hypothetical protein